MLQNTVLTKNFTTTSTVLVTASTTRTFQVTATTSPSFTNTAFTACTATTGQSKSRMSVDEPQSFRLLLYLNVTFHILVRNIYTKIKEINKTISIQCSQNSNPLWSFCLCHVFWKFQSVSHAFGTQCHFQYISVSKGRHIDNKKISEMQENFFHPRDPPSTSDQDQPIAFFQIFDNVLSIFSFSRGKNHFFHQTPLVVLCPKKITCVFSTKS